jgi:ankyrin repeat protein
MAAWTKQLGMVELLLEAGADPNGMKLNAPLASAAFRGRVRMVRLLLSQPNIEVDKIDVDGQTPLISAAQMGHARVVELLLEAGADPSIKDERGETAEDKAGQYLEKIKGMAERLGRKTKQGAAGKSATN